jgi:hypothetical protein
MGNISTLSGEIKNVLNAVQLGGSNAFVEVLERASNQFTGFPSATIVPGETGSDYATTVQNERTYVFYVYIYDSLENLEGTGTDADTAWENIRDLMDLILDGLDNSNDLNNTCNFLRPVPLQPLETDVGGSGAVLVAPIRLECVKSIELT